MKRTIQILCLLMLAAMFVGCASTVEIDRIPKMALTEDSSGSGVAKNKRFQVIVTGIEDEHGNKDAGDLGNIALGRLNSVIRDSGAKNVAISRQLRGKLDTEFDLIELEGGVSNYSSPKAADIALRGTIDSAYLSSNFNAKEVEAAIAKSTGTSPPLPMCNYTANISGTITAFGVNPVNEIQSFSLDQSTNFEQKAEYGACPELSTKKARQLFQEAAAEAVDEQKNKLKAILASQGFVVAAKQDPATGDIYYRLSTQPKSGAQPGVGVEFFKTEVVDGYSDQIRLATGSVICSHKKDRVAWARLENKEDAAKIFKGTRYRLIFKEDFLSKLMGQGGESPGLEALVGCNP